MGDWQGAPKSVCSSRFLSGKCKQREELFPTSSLCLSACSHLAMHNPCALWFVVPWLVLFWCIVAHNLKFPWVPLPIPPWFTLLLLSHADKFFTPHHQRRLLPAERHLSTLSSLLSIRPSLSVFAFLSSSCFRPHVDVKCIPSLVQNPRIFLHCVKNKHPSFYVSCISLLCPFFPLFVSIYFKVALIKPGSLYFNLFFSDFVSSPPQSISRASPLLPLV